MYKQHKCKLNPWSLNVRHQFNCYVCIYQMLVDIMFLYICRWKSHRKQVTYGDDLRKVRLTRIQFRYV